MKALKEFNEADTAELLNWLNTDPSGLLAKEMMEKAWNAGFKQGEAILNAHCLEDSRVDPFPSWLANPLDDPKNWGKFDAEQTQLVKELMVRAYYAGAQEPTYAWKRSTFATWRNEAITFEGWLTP